MKRTFLFAILLFAATIVSAQTVEGRWSATIRGPIVTIEFRSPAFDNDSWTDSTDFRLSNLGDKTNGHFSISRDAGTVAFYGKFDHDKGSGTYVFTLNKPFAEAVAASGVTTVNALEGFVFFRSGFKTAYFDMLRHAGLKGIAAHQAISMYALKIDEPFINQFKAIGYSDIPVHNLLTFKAMHIDAAFISGFRKLGYSNIPLNDLPALKANHITPEYVAEMQQKGIRETSLRKYIQLKRTYSAQ
ncbi:hypothetical protein [Mucilaginibacter sp.]|uniref:hypothetical protein n=1 Tax=Mucilaginibacter sp. TaxID=1882438 RepID=UPI002606ED09|nr:hypothetical protein [Mucilaginibacter sp.]MDB4923548.1 hypothetical protein [Mucilaginibacter sp.]